MRLFLVMLAALLCSTPALSQTASTEQDLISRVNRQLLLLRGLYAGEKLKFDATGKLTSRPSTTSPMLSAVSIDNTELKTDRLVLKGHRQAILYNDHNFARKNAGDVSIEIAAPINGDYTLPLAAIFTEKLADLAPAAPDYWQHFLLHGEEIPVHHDKNSLAQSNAASTDPLDPTLRKIGGTVQAPKVISAGEPKFDDEARRLKVSGTILVYLQVDREGNPEKIHIVRPLGAGLDEKAVAAVSTYKFKPAMENNQAVRVEMNVEISFRIF